MRFFRKPKEQHDETPSPQDEDAPGKPLTLLADRLAELVAAVPGAIGAAAVDYETGVPLAVAGHDGADPEAAGAANLAVVRAELNVLGTLGLNDQIEDIQITLGRRTHLIRSLRANAGVFVDLALSRPAGNSGLARHQLRTFAAELEL